MTAEPGRARRPQPRWLLRGSWAIHRAVFRASGGRLGLREAEPERLGTLRLRTLGRHSGQERTSMLFYLEDGANLAVVAANAGASSEPAWLLNLRATPEAFVDLPDGVHAVVGRVATVQEQGRLWDRFEALLDAYTRYQAVAQRAIPVVILEPTDLTVGRVPVAELAVRAIVFDMDGVLIDSGDIYGRHWEHWAATRGIDIEQVRKMHPGRPPADTIRLVAPELDARAEAERFNATFVIEHAIDEVRAMPGAVELVAALPSGRWTIATSAQKATARSWLMHVGLPLPQEFVAVDDVERGKPAPDPYLLAARLVGVDPGDCLVIEDAPAGITAAKAAGASVLALRTSHIDAELQQADAVTDDLRDVFVEFRDGRLSVRW